MRFHIHDLRVEMTCPLTMLIDPINAALGEFAGDSMGSASAPIVGSIRSYDADEVRRYLSPTATRITAQNDPIELYQEAERFWLIDDHWGLAEINILRGYWRNWIVPEPAADGHRIVDRAILWPIAQLLRPRGLCLVPAAAVVRDGWGVLILSQFQIEPELSALVRAGWRIIGQSWVALRDAQERVSMLWMPGQVERSARFGAASRNAKAERIDLTAEFCGCRSDRANCDAVLLIAPHRRPVSGLRPLSAPNAMDSLRRAWPIPELHPHRRQGGLLPRLAKQSRVFDMQLSRDPKDILHLMDRTRFHRPSAPSVAVRVHARGNGLVLTRSI